MLEYWNVGNNHPPSLFHYSIIPLFQVPLRQTTALELIHGLIGGPQRLFGTPMKKRLSREKPPLSPTGAGQSESGAGRTGKGILYGFIAKHLSVFTLWVSQYHASDKRRPNQIFDLTLSGSCPKPGYAVLGYSSL